MQGVYSDVQWCLPFPIVFGMSGSLRLVVACRIEFFSASSAIQCAPIQSAYLNTKRPASKHSELFAAEPEQPVAQHYRLVMHNFLVYNSRSLAWKSFYFLRDGVFGSRDLRGVWRTYQILWCESEILQLLVSEDLLHRSSTSDFDPHYTIQASHYDLHWDISLESPQTRLHLRHPCRLHRQ